MKEKGLLIGFGHKRLRGKDTASRLALSHLSERDVPCRLDSFAKTLKEVCKVVFGFSDARMESSLYKEKEDEFWGFSPRWALQRVGTECFRRNIGYDVWVKTLLKRYKDDPSMTVVISDVRFVNEAEAIHVNGGYLIKCNREVVPFDNLKDIHESETSLDGYQNWDYELGNNGTLEDLNNKVKAIIDDILYNNVGV